MAETPDIYGEAPVFSRQPGKSAIAIPKSTPPPGLEFPVSLGPSPALRKVWSGPIVSREKLVDTLNLMEPEGYVILTVHSLSVGQVQIIAYQEE